MHLHPAPAVAMPGHGSRWILVAGGGVLSQAQVQEKTV